MGLEVCNALMVNVCTGGFSFSGWICHYLHTEALKPAAIGGHVDTVHCPSKENEAVYSSSYG